MVYKQQNASQRLRSVHKTTKCIALNPPFPFRILFRSFGEKSEGKPGRISHVIGGTVVTAVPCKCLKRHNVMGVALSRNAKKSSCPRIQLHMALLISRTGEDGYKAVS